MPTEVFRYLRFYIIIILIQVLLLNNMQFAGFINPQLYVVIIILLPLGVSKPLSLLIGFCLGLFIDIFTSTLGLHAAAATFAAYIRPYLLRIMSPKDGYSFIESPTADRMGWNWFLYFSSMMILGHHLFLFISEAFHFREIWNTLFRVLASSLFTLILVVTYQMLTFNRKK